MTITCRSQSHESHVGHKCMTVTYRSQSLWQSHVGQSQTLLNMFYCHTCQWDPFAVTAGDKLATSHYSTLGHHHNLQHRSFPMPYAISTDLTCPTCIMINILYKIRLSTMTGYIKYRLWGLQPPRMDYQPKATLLISPIYHSAYCKALLYIYVLYCSKCDCHLYYMSLLNRLSL